MNNKECGYYGEDICVEYLKNNSYEILERNFNSKNGEIDIIAKENDELVFIEVKTRRNFKYGIPIEAINDAKIKHIKKAAIYYLHKTKNENANVRFDAIEVYILNNKIKLNHIKQIV